MTCADCERGPVVLSPDGRRRCVEHALAYWHEATEPRHNPTKETHPNLFCRAHNCWAIPLGGGFCPNHELRYRPRHWEKSA